MAYAYEGNINRKPKTMKNNDDTKIYLNPILNNPYYGGDDVLDAEDNQDTGKAEIAFENVKVTENLYYE